MAASVLLPDPSHADYDAINLRRALPRLEEKILNPDPRLLRSSFERRKTASNLEYARTLLLRLERAAARRPRARTGGSAPSTPRADLGPQRARLKRLHDRLYELEQRGDGDGGDAPASDESEPEDLLARYCAAPAAAAEGEAVSAAQAPSSPAAAIAASLPRAADGPHTKTSTAGLRPRHGRAGSRAADEATTTSAAPRPPLASHPLPSSGSRLPLPPTPGAAAALEGEEAAQTDLTTSLLALAGQLKGSARAFGADLDADAAALAGAEGALGASHERLGAATRSMGVLRRMSEGRWWWGRMALYAAIAALWVVALLFVFLGPKLRF